MLDSSSFNYTPEVIDRIRKGYYSAIYFWRTKEILEKDQNFRRVVMQVFQRHGSILCGINEVVSLFRIGTGYWENKKWIDTYSSLIISSLSDGDSIHPLESVLHVDGPYHSFAHLESLYLGILARRTRVASSVRRVVEVAGGKDVVFFADRFDHFFNQEGDGYAAHIGGAKGVATDAQGAWWQEKGMGTMPHALIASYNGNTVLASEKFHEYFSRVPLIVLVDFHNDVIKTSLEVAKKFGKKLYGVRLDTSFDLIDMSLSQSEKNRGVNPVLVKKLRKALDDEGFQYVKIIVSGGFNVEKISLFEKENAPVDVYGVGSYLLQSENDYTADIVQVDGIAVSKVGRVYSKNSRLKIVS